MQVPRTATLLKRDSNRSFFQWILSIIQEHLFCRGSMNGWFWNTDLFKKTSFFYRTSPVVHSHIFRFPACNFIKKETPASMFFFEFCKIFKNIFWQDTFGWLLLVCNCEFWEVVQITSFIEYLWETSYFKYKLLDFNHQIQEKSILQVLFKHFIQEQEKAIRRLEAATRGVLRNLVKFTEKHLCQSHFLIKLQGSGQQLY